MLLKPCQNEEPTKIGFVTGVSQEFPSATDAAPAAVCGTLAAEDDWTDGEFGLQEQWTPTLTVIVSSLLEATAPMA